MAAFYNPMMTPQQQMQQIEQRMAMYPNFSQQQPPMMPMASMQPMAVQNNSDINWVNGFEGAKAALIPLDKPVLLMDSTDSKFYIKQINAQGAPVIQAYRFEPIDASTQSKAAPVPTAATATAPATPEVATLNESVLLEKLVKMSERLEAIEQKINVPNTKGVTKNG